MKLEMRVEMFELKEQSLGAEPCLAMHNKPFFSMGAMML
jgi:hypothetical protein